MALMGRTRPALTFILLMSLTGLLLVLALLAPRAGTTQPFTLLPPSRPNGLALQNAPVATYSHWIYLPLVSMPEESSDRIGPITPLSASVPRYAKFEIAFTISTTATNLYFPYDPAAPYGESGVTVDMLLSGLIGGPVYEYCKNSLGRPQMMWFVFAGVGLVATVGLALLARGVRENAAA